MTAPSSKNVCRSLGLTQRRHLPDHLKFCSLGPTGPTISCISDHHLHHSCKNLVQTVVWSYWMFSYQIEKSMLRNINRPFLQSFSSKGPLFWKRTIVLLVKCHIEFLIWMKWWSCIRNNYTSFMFLLKCVSGFWWHFFLIFDVS